MALFNRNKESKEDSKLEAIREFIKYKPNQIGDTCTLRSNKISLFNTYPYYCVMGSNDRIKYHYELANELYNNDDISADDIETEIINKLNKDFGESYEIGSEELKKAKKLAKVDYKENNYDVSNKFGVDLSDCIKCTMEEQRRGTFSNNRQRDVVNAYIKVDNDKLDIFKESIWIHSNMGKETIHYDNIANIDLDNRGILNASGQLVISLKTNKEIVLKMFKDNNGKDKIVDSYNNYMNKSSGGDNNNADNLLIYAELYKDGLLTREEFEAKKKELL